MNKLIRMILSEKEGFEKVDFPMGVGQYYFIIYHNNEKIYVGKLVAITSRIVKTYASGHQYKKYEYSFEDVHNPITDEKFENREFNDTDYIFATLRYTYSHFIQKYGFGDESLKNNMG
jgi:hypothetical protein